MKHTQNENAVSPVIGVLLMVMITVVLAAVIASFVFGMSGSITKTKIVAATVTQPDADNIVVTYMGGQDAGSFDFGTVNVTNDDGDFVETTDLTSQVGSTVTANDPGLFSKKNHVIVIGHFTDGSAQVLIDTYV